MNSLLKPNLDQVHIVKQRGVVLFFTLIALLAMSLAAVALIRSVDTSTMIAGNLAFKQSATSSGDAGIEAAIASLTTVDAANSGLDVLNDATHPFNVTNLATRPGYYSSVGSLNLFADTTWDNDINGSNDTSLNSVLVGTDGSGNKTRYIIERMCRTANTALQDADCLFSGISDSGDEAGVKTMQETCDPSPCASMSPPPQIRITARATGSKNSVSYLQAFVY